MKLNSRNERRVIRHKRLRKNLKTSVERPRLSVYKSNTHISVQLIDDEKANTLASSSTLALKLKTNTVADAAKVGEDIAKKVLALGIKKIAFDTGGSTYHGKIKALAEAMRTAGLEF